MWTTSFLAFFALSAAWALASPLTSVPDEPSHIIKAAATARGQLHGTPVTVITNDWGDPKELPETGYRLPASYSVIPNMHECYFVNAEQPASCAPDPGSKPGVGLASTTAGANNPLYYLAVGWPSLLSDGVHGMYGMRLVSAGICAALLASAVVTASQWSRRRLFPLAAVLAAATPMVLFLNGSVNPNSVEASSAILLWTVMLSLLTDPQPALTDRLLTRAGIATLALIAARQLGPAWALGILVCAALAGEPGVLRALVRRRAVWAWTAAIAFVGIGAFAWTARFSVLGTTSVSHPDLTFGTAATYTLGQTVNYLNSMVGFFGWLDVRPPYHAEGVWFVLVAAILVAACVTARRRELVSLGGLGASVVAIPVLAQGRQAQHLGYIWQGRYLLAVAVGLPLLAAAILAKRTTTGTARAAEAPHRSLTRPLARVVDRLPVFVTVLALADGFLMFASTLRRYAVGVRGPWLLSGTSWSPPGGALSVVLLYVLGMALAAWTVFGSRPRVAAEGVDTFTVSSTAEAAATEAAGVQEEADSLVGAGISAPAGR